MMDPPVESLLDKVDSKFTLVTLAAKRGRQINSYFNQLGEGLGAIVPPQVASVSRKPLSIALEEISAGKIVYVPGSESDEGEEPALEAVEGGGSAVETPVEAEVEPTFTSDSTAEAVAEADDVEPAEGPDAG
jgi:DNA-directed RNA polymerase subunit omega